MNAIPRPAVRAATANDAAQLAVIHVRSWQVAYRGLLPQEYLDRMDSSDRAERWRHALSSADWPKSGVLVVAPGREVLGFARFGPTRDQDADGSLVGEIKEIYLMPEAWGKGMGKRLMSNALARLASAGYNQVTLWVLATNHRARRFYASGGWIEDGALKRDDSQGFPIEDVRYRKQLA
jgi:ribosomal protein S18 acetylase RimI-like enzyme